MEKRATKQKGYEAKEPKYAIAHFDGYSYLFGFPKNLARMRTLEIGSSQSDFVATLRRQGADAYGIDTGYKNMSALTQRIDADLKLATCDEQDLINNIQRARARFRADFSSVPDHYIAANSIALPFGNNCFDIVYSCYGISPVISQNAENLRLSIKEIIRVLTAGGRATFFPFDNHEDLLYSHLKKAQEHKKNLEYGVRWLDKTSHRYELGYFTNPDNENALLGRRGFLTIIKS